MKNSEEHEQVEVQPIVPYQPIKKQAEDDKIQSYLKFLGVRDKEQMMRIHDLQLSNLDSFVYYDPQSPFSHELNVKIIRHTKNYEFVDLDIRIGHYIFPKITIFNIDKKSPVHIQEEIGRGSFGKIYKCKCRGKKLAVKCFQNPLNSTASNTVFKMVLYEYCLLILASRLMAGPQMEKVLGYSIMFFSNCIEIIMEFCQEIESQNDLSFLKLLTDLKESMLRLHSLNIIHFDIKKENIAFSPSFKKCVFIDYGLSKIIKESFGQKSLTTFRGTYWSCSSEMKQLYKSNKSSYVDLYYNDLQSLKNIFSSEQPRNDRDVYADSIFKKDKILDVTYFHQLYSLQYALFSCDFQLFRSLKINENNNKMLEKLFEFINNLKPSLQLRELTSQILQKFDKDDKFFKSYTLIANTKFVQSSKQQQEKQSFLKELLNTINIDQSLSRYITSMNQKSKEWIKNIGKILSNREDIKKLKRIDYLLLLSKAIELNSTKFSIGEITFFCNLAINILEVKDYQLESRFCTVYQLSQITSFLFQQSLRQKLQETYFDIFLYSLNNAVILRLYSIEQLLTFYQSLVEIPLQFQKKVRLFHNFTTMMVWYGHQCDYYDKVVNFYQIFYHKNMTIVQQAQNKYGESGKLRILKLVLALNQKQQVLVPQDKQILPLINYDHELLIDIKLRLYSVLYVNKGPQSQMVLEKISELLTQKELFSSYFFLHVHFLLLLQFFSKVSFAFISNILKNYQKVNIMQNGSLLKILKLMRECLLKENQLEAAKQLVSKLQIEVKHINNKYLHYYLWKVLQRIFIKIGIDEGTQQNYTFIIKLINLKKQCFIRFIQYDRSAFGSYQLFGIILLEKTAVSKFPIFSFRQKIIEIAFPFYIKQYKKIQLKLRQNCMQYSMIEKIALLMILALLLLFMGKKIQALSLCNKLYPIIKAYNFQQKLQIFFKDLKSFLGVISQYFPNKSQLKDYYLLYHQITTNKTMEKTLIKFIPQTKIIIQLLLENDLEKLVQLVKRISKYCLMYRSNANLFQLMRLTVQMNIRLSKSKQLSEKYVQLCKRISIHENPYHILWLIFFYYDRCNQLSFQPVIKMFYRIADNLRNIIRSAVFNIIISYYVKMDQKLFSFRKYRNLCLIIAKYHQRMGKKQLNNLCKKLFMWDSTDNMNRQKVGMLLKKLQKYSQAEKEYLNRKLIENNTSQQKYHNLIQKLQLIKKRGMNVLSCKQIS